ncbi:MAG: hypothetical protein QGI75_08615 [Phycisphaerales bacterium]|jgi:hypothetical protein|nr:hypothetical protein [Phycisphaerales bacterium]
MLGGLVLRRVDDDSLKRPGTFDGLVGVNDILAVIGSLRKTDGSGDANGDGVCDVNNVLFVVANFGRSC